MVSKTQKRYDIDILGTLLFTNKKYGNFAVDITRIKCPTSKNFCDDVTNNRSIIILLEQF